MKVRGRSKWTQTKQGNHTLPSRRKQKATGLVYESQYLFQGAYTVGSQIEVHGHQQQFLLLNKKTESCMLIPRVGIFL